MAVIKCKMCGGDLTIAENVSVAECEYCGTKQTVPAVDDEKKITLFSRANRLRLACEFDKAAGIYESIVAEFPEEAEAYWGLVLCKYGIEYVDDPKTGKKIPTCHRSSFDSVMEDSDFEMVLEYADVVARGVYREEAKAIERIRQGILEVSTKEEPYDIFICYKETDFNGERTLDSVLAQDIYDALTEKGYRTFFARITLEDKLGQMYEPYIFAALNSAKVMLAIGTDYEYYNAVWVKNEWSRFLSLIEKGEKKTLIPCYKGLDAYDMPKEFKRLQAQDLGKVGAIQDLLRGIGKILGDQRSIPNRVHSGTANGNAMTQRGMIYLEDGEFENARTYFDRALDENPADSDAYLGKFLAEHRACSIDALEESALIDVEEAKDLKRALQFAQPAMAEKLSVLRETLGKRWTRVKLTAVLGKYYSKRRLEYTKEQNEQMRLEGIYQKACNELENACTEKDYKDICDDFKSIEGYKNSAALAELSLSRIPEVKQAHDMISELRSLDSRKKSVEERKKQIGQRIENLELQKEKLTSLAKDFPEIEREMHSVEVELNSCKETIFELKCEKGKLGFFAGKRKKEIDQAVRDKEYKICVLQSKLSELESQKGGYTTTDKIDYSFNEMNEKIKELQSERDELEAMMTMTKAEIVDRLKKLGCGSAVLKQYEEVKQLKEKCRVNSCISFGTYEQGSNNKEGIEWLVLEVRGDRALIISKDVLDVKRYNETGDKVTWEKCSLRRWLNNEFWDLTFNEVEKQVVCTSVIPADKSPESWTSAGNSTQDKVFLLGVTESNKYFKSSSLKVCKDTNYVKSKYPSNYGYWWLRSPGLYQNMALCINYEGVEKSILNARVMGVRPAMWIDISD